MDGQGSDRAAIPLQYRGFSKANGARVELNAAARVKARAMVEQMMCDDHAEANTRDVPVVPHGDGHRQDGAEIPLQYGGFSKANGARVELNAAARVKARAMVEQMMCDDHEEASRVEPHDVPVVPRGDGHRQDGAAIPLQYGGFSKANGARVELNAAARVKARAMVEQMMCDDHAEASRVAPHDVPVVPRGDGHRQDGAAIPLQYGGFSKANGARVELNAAARVKARAMVEQMMCDGQDEAKQEAEAHSFPSPLRELEWACGPLLLKRRTEAAAPNLALKICDHNQKKLELEASNDRGLHAPHRNKCPMLHLKSIHQGSHKLNIVRLHLS
ncbi:MAG: hypothetical protein SGPRY_003848 [Prymnesium sp.]